MFVDSVTVTLTAGSGGNGVVAWRREKYIPKGGPYGGNGGGGGSVILRTDPSVLSLESYRNRRLINAENGRPGGANLQQGRSGEDLVLKIPCGTLVKDAKTQEILFDFNEEKGQEWEICKGGRGGKGNDHFKSPTNQAPNTATPGTPGEAREVELELKLIADAGFVGMPNAGKSTLLSKITYANVKIGAYPFTTLIPNLSTIQFDDYSRILVADIPGIIEGAHCDKGLGLSFLKHIERTAVLVYVIDISGSEDRNPLDDFRILREEIAAYNPDILEKPFLIALNKIDLPESAENAKLFREKYPFPTFEISALANSGVAALTEAMRTFAQAGGKRF